MNIRLFLLGVACGLLVLLQNAEAVTYKYEDKTGMICFADDIQSIPEQYRSQAVLIEGELKEVSTTGTATLTTSGVQTAVPGAPAEQKTIEIEQPGTQAPLRGRPLSVRLMMTVGLGVALLVLAGVIDNLKALEEQRQVRSYVNKGAVMLFLVYLVFAHGRDALTVFRMAGKTVNDVQRESALKGQKAAEGIKKLDSMFEELQRAEEAFKKEEAASENQQ